jgi:hypothetical protein
MNIIGRFFQFLGAGAISTAAVSGVTIAGKYVIDVIQTPSYLLVTLFLLVILLSNVLAMTIRSLF